MCWNVFFQKSLYISQSLAVIKNSLGGLSVSSSHVPCARLLSILKNTGELS